MNSLWSVVLPIIRRKGNRTETTFVFKNTGLNNCIILVIQKTTRSKFY